MGRSAVRARGCCRARLRPRPDLGLVATGADGEAVAGRDGVVPNLKGRAATVALVTRRPPRTGLSHESEYTNCYPDLDDGQVEEVGGVVLVRVEREVELLAMEATDPRDHVHLRAAAVGRWMVQGGVTASSVGHAGLAASVKKEPFTVTRPSCTKTASLVRTCGREGTGGHWRMNRHTQAAGTFSTR